MHDWRMLARIVGGGGGEYIGVQEGLLPEVPPQVLFNDPKTGTTLAVPVEGITAERVRERIERARAL